MTAHIQFPALDPTGDPATLSRPILTGLLRGELGYQGVVVTDALGMQGVRTKYGDARVPVLALRAGVDQLLDPPDLWLAYDSVLAAVHSGELSEQRIDQSVYRILRLKWCRGLFAQRYVDEGSVEAVVGQRDNLAVANEITERTTTLVKNDARLLPLPAGRRHLLLTGWSRSLSSPPPMPLTLTTLAAELAKRHAMAEVLETGTQPTKALIGQAVLKAKANDVTLVITNDAGNAKAYGPGQQQLVKALVATGKPVIVVAVGTPYDIAYFTEAPTYLASYAHNAPAMAAVVKVVFGEVSPSGRLPVPIPTAGRPNTLLYEYGHGLRYRQ